MNAGASIADNLTKVHARIQAAARRAGRAPTEIALMAVTKTVPPERIRQAHAAGLRLFGENRVQEFASKIDQLRDLQQTSWHMIGHLQSNKAGKAVELFTGVDSLDSLKLAEKLNAAAEEAGKRLPVLVELNLGGEESKSGLRPGSPEIDRLLHAAPHLSSLEILGLMTLPPFTEDPQGARQYFRQLRELRDQIAARNLPSVSMDTLSMGMSHDFEVAIEEGSTCVRLGTGIFGPRPVPR